MLLRRQRLPLRPQHPQRPDDLHTGPGRGDDGVHVPALGGDVGVHQRVLVVLDEPPAFRLDVVARFRRTLSNAAKEGKDVEALRAELIEDYADHFANPYIAAERGYIDDVIIPHETRPKVIDAFDTLRTKREPGPKRKHGNIPL